MQNNKTHAFENPALHSSDRIIIHLMVCHVSPPNEDIGFVQPIFIETVVPLVKPGRGDFQRRISSQEFGDSRMHAIRVKGGNFRVLFFVAKFTPNNNANTHGVWQ